MDRDTLDPICWQAGITTGYGDRAVPEATKLALLTALGIDPAAPDFTHVPAYDRDPAQAGACALPAWLVERPTWGLFCQLYELRSEQSWGIGDFADLARLARIAGAAGADFLGVNPLHALFLADPDRRSPFMPSNRRYLNPLYIAMDDLPGPVTADRAALAALAADDLVDYPAVAGLKLGALAGVFAASRFETGRFAEADFEAFRAEGGAALARHALFEALSAAMVAAGHGAGWKSWPAPYQSPDSPEVVAFAAAEAEAVSFHVWLQWLATRQLEAARAAARDAGLRIGLYLDLAVGEAPDGSAAWSAPELILPGLDIGAPPDVFAQAGQNWVLAAPSPVGLAQAGYAPFRALIAAQLAHAGALRIDHVMALRQLFLIPSGDSPRAGTHMAYPLAEMLSVVTDESRKAGAVMIGEDLGWVPDGFRESMAAANLLTMRILYFEQDWGLFRRAASYPAKALACLSTHDLPTLAAWWRGDDVAARRTFGLIDTAKARADTARRGDERIALVNAMIDGGELAPGAPDATSAELTPALLTATYRFLAATPSVLVGVRLADLVGPETATNVPGTTDEHPNWQRRAPVPLEAIAGTPAFQQVTAAMRAARPRG